MNLLWMLKIIYNKTRYKHRPSNNNTKHLNKTKKELRANPLKISISLTIQMAANEGVFVLAISFGESVVMVTWSKRAKRKFDGRQGTLG